MKKLFILLLLIPFAGISQTNDSSASLRSSIVRAAVITCDKCGNVATELNFATNGSKEAARVFYDDGWRNINGLIYCYQCNTERISTEAKRFYFLYTRYGARQTWNFWREIMARDPADAEDIGRRHYFTGDFKYKYVATIK